MPNPELLEVAKRLSELEADKLRIQEEIWKCRNFLRATDLTEKIEFDAVGVSLHPRRPFFRKDHIKSKFNNIPTDVLVQLVDAGFVEEREVLGVNEEKIYSLPAAEQTSLIEKGIINKEVVRKPVRSPDAVDENFIDQMKREGVFEDQLNLVRVKKEKSP